jgi:hypothetical protein
LIDCFFWLKVADLQGGEPVTKHQWQLEEVVDVDHVVSGFWAKDDGARLDSKKGEIIAVEEASREPLQAKICNGGGSREQEALKRADRDDIAAGASIRHQSKLAKIDAWRSRNFFLPS